MNLNGLNPITEENKQEWINWIGGILNSLDNVDYNNFNTNRVLGTDRDDIDEIRDFLGSMFLTLQNFIIAPKVAVVSSSRPSMPSHP